MALDFASDPHAEMSHLVNDLHVDGLFTDCPSTARDWWNGLQAQEGQLHSPPTLPDSLSGPEEALHHIRRVLAPVLIVSGAVLVGCLVWWFYEWSRVMRRYTRFGVDEPGEQVSGAGALELQDQHRPGDQGRLDAST